MFQSLAATLPCVPYVTILTDLADYPPAFWIEHNQKQHFVCGTPKAVDQARAAGHPESHIHATSGMIISPEFYRPSTVDRDAERSRHGLNPGQPTGLVMFGGYGSNAMRALARQLPDTQLILLCGHNHSLAEQLRAMTATAPRLVVGFSSDVAYYMRLSDFFIGKPGPGSISEALHQQLPLIVVRNSWTLPQERYNTQWIRQNNVGIVLPSFRHVRNAVSDLTARLAEFRANTRRLDNLAVHEIPEILDSILKTAAQVSPRAAQPVKVQLDGDFRDANSAY
jgi:UDP-N-acetylglucosamine:LPS N-acetylglucosamine transferase